EIRVPDHSPSSDHRKGAGDQRKPEHAGVSSRETSDQDGDQRSGAKHFQSESIFGTYRELPGKRKTPRTLRRLSSGLEKSICAVEGRRKDAGVRAEFI